MVKARKSIKSGSSAEKNRELARAIAKEARKSRKSGSSYAAASALLNAAASSSGGMTYGRSSLDQGELKGVDYRTAFNPVVATTDTNDCMHTLTLVPPGSGSYQRVGRKIVCKSIRLKGIVRCDLKRDGTTGDLTGNTLRMVVVYDQSPAGAIPNFNTIFGHTAQSGAQTSEFLDPLNLRQTGRFKVLRELVWDCNPEAYPSEGTTHVVSSSWSIDEYIPLDDIVTTYSGNSETAQISDISTGAIYLIFRARANTADDKFVVTDKFSVRLRYVD